MKTNAVSSEQLTIVVNTCDDYSDVLEIFFLALEDLWSDRSWPVVINAEAKSYSHRADVHNFKSATAEDDWGMRLGACLRDVCSEFVLMLFDDFILRSRVDVRRISEVVDMMSLDKQIVVTYLIKTGAEVTDVSDKKKFLEIRNKANYKMNSAPAIWRREELIRYTRPGDTPWAWEVFGSYRTWRDGGKFLTLNSGLDDIYPYDYSRGGAIYRGRWVRQVVEEVAEKYSVDIDWSTRGFASDYEREKRSWLWRLKFLALGFRMVGFRASYFLLSYVRDKLSAR